MNGRRKIEVVRSVLWVQGCLANVRRCVTLSDSVRVPRQVLARVIVREEEVRALFRAKVTRALFQACMP